MENNEIKAKKPFGFMDKLAYAAGDFGCNMSFALKGTVQTFWLFYMFMNDELMAALLLVVQIWDAINDPMIGSLIDADRRKYKMGKFKTYIFIGAIGLTVAGALVFLPFPNANNVVKSILFVLGYIVWDAFYTVANVPYGSMLPLITEDVGERTQLSTWRSVGSMVGNLLPTMILPALIWSENEAGESVLLGERVFWAALLMGVMGLVAFLFMIKKITIRVDESTVKTTEKVAKFNVIKAFGNFMKNRPAVGATLAAMGMFLGMQSATTVNTLVFVKYFHAEKLAGVVQVIGFLPMFLFMPFIKKLVNKYGKKECSVVGTLVSLVGGAVMLVFPLVPTTGSLPLIIYMIGLVFFGLGMGVYTCVSWAFMADAIDYNEWKFGAREEGTVYSLHSFFRKLAQGVGPSLVIIVMGWLGYVSDYGVNQEDPIVHRMCWLLAGLYIFSAVLQLIGVALINNLDKKTLETMTAELEARRAEASAEIVAE